MPLSEMLLALVDEPLESHGYAIHARLTQIFPASHRCERREVYALLRHLEAEGFVASSWISGRDRRRRRKYRLLQPGRLRLEGWLLCPRPSRGLLRRAELVRVAILASSASADGLRYLEARLRHLTRQSVAQRRSVRVLRGFSGLVATRSLAHLEAEIEALGTLVGVSSPTGLPRGSGW